MQYMIASPSEEIRREVTKLLIILYDRVKYEANDSYVVAPLLQLILINRQAITQSQFVSLTMDLSKSSNSNCSSTMLKVYTVNVLSIVASFTSIPSEVLPVVAMLFGCLMNDPDTIVRKKCLIVFSKTTPQLRNESFIAKTMENGDNTTLIFLTHSATAPGTKTSYLNTDPSIDKSPRFLHICESVFCRQLETAQRIWTIIERVRGDVQYLNEMYTKDAINSEQQKAIKSIPLNFFFQKPK